MRALSQPERALLNTARRGVLVTITSDGRPRPVPITFALDEGAEAGELILYSALDEKPKSVADPRDLARVRDIVARPRVSVLVDHWSEEWPELGWVRLAGNARLIGPDDESVTEHVRAVGLLRARYAQYANHRLEGRPMIAIDVVDVTSWFASP